MKIVQLSTFAVLSGGIMADFASAGIIVIPPTVSVTINSNVAEDTSLNLSPTWGSSATNAFSHADFTGLTLPGDAAGTELQSGSITTGTGYVIESLYAIKVDPFIETFQAVKNTLNVPQTFIITTTLPVAAMPGTNYYGGSAGFTVTDVNGAGGSITTVPGTPLFQGLADGTPVFSLFNAPFTLQTTPGVNQSATASATNGLDVNSFPDTSLMTTNVLTSIGVVHTFTLSPGDIAGFTTYFRVETPGNLPEPTMLGFLGIGALVALRRRKH